METERFEGKIKRELRDREITPSAGSWDKLSAKLDATEEKKKPFVLWMGIAASIIGGILILSLVFNNLIPLDSPEIVDVPKNEIKLEKTQVENSEEIFIPTKTEVKQVATAEVEEVEKNQSTPRTKGNVIKKIESSQSNRDARAVIDNTNLIKEQTLITPTVVTSDKILDAKLNDAVANVLSQTKNGQIVTDAEVNELLAEAAAKISQERYKSDFAVGKVDPQDLLQDVEFEMDKSFRDKIFDMLKEGYSKAKTAVANRNY